MAKTASKNHDRIDDILRTEDAMLHAVDRQGRIKRLIEHNVWDDYERSFAPLDNHAIRELMHATLEREFMDVAVAVGYDVRADLFTVAVSVDGMTVRARPEETTDEYIGTARRERPLTNGEVARQVFETLAEEAHVLMMEAIDLYGAACLQD